jgi:hypothetical protein
MQAKRRLPLSLAQFGLLNSVQWKLTRGLHYVPAPEPWQTCTKGRGR